MARSKSAFLSFDVIYWHQAALERNDRLKSCNLHHRDTYVQGRKREKERDLTDPTAIYFLALLFKKNSAYTHEDSLKERLWTSSSRFSFTQDESN